MAQIDTIFLQEDHLKITQITPDTSTAIHPPNRATSSARGNLSSFVLRGMIPNITYFDHNKSHKRFELTLKAQQRAPKQYDRNPNSWIGYVRITKSLANEYNLGSRDALRLARNGISDEKSLHLALDVDLDQNASLMENYQFENLDKYLD